MSSSLNSLAIISAARADEDEHEGHGESHVHGDADDEDVWEMIHEGLANAVMALVVLHLLGVLLSSLVHRENLIGSMLSGEKRAE